jgi:hypothetical protein
MVAEFDPFAAAGFAPIEKPKVGAVDDPFAAAGFAPMSQAPASLPVAPMPTPTGFDEFGTPQFDSSTPEGLAANRQVRQIPLKAAEGATLGLLPHILAGAGVLGGKPYGEGLQQARTDLAQASADQPVASGIAEASGSLLPTVLGYRAAGPLIGAAERYAPRVGGFLARALTGGALGGASSAGHDIGTGETANLGSDVAAGAGTGAALQGGGELLGRALVQPISNMGRSLLQSARNVYSPAGKQGVVGQILREASGDFANDAATSPIPGITLNAAQATGNPGVASLTNMMAPDMAGTVKTAEDMVQGGKTPAQTTALARALVPAYAGEEPQTILNTAGARGTKAIIDLDTALGKTETALWNTPEMKAVRLNGPGVANGVSQDVAQFPASFRDAVTGPQAKLGAYLSELHELGPEASISDVNSVRSRLLAVARGAASGPQPDPVTAAAANRMAGSIVNHIGNDPAITGVAAKATAPVTELHSIPGEPGSSVPVDIAGTSTAAKAGDATALPAYQKARDFTRQFNEAKGYNEFNSILYPNRQGNIQGNPEKQFGQFFDLSGGTSSGMDRLAGLTNFARQTGHHIPANEVEAAARDYMRAGMLRAARGGGQVNAAGQPIVNPATVAKVANTIAPAIAPGQGSMVAPLAPEMRDIGETARLLNRPSTLRGDANSTTYEKLKSNDLVSAIVGQGGSSALGGALGGYAGYRAGDATGQPAWQTIPLGIALGATLGNRAGPTLGKVVATTPGVRALVTGPSQDIQRRLAAALSSLPEYQAALATPLQAGPRLMAPGRGSDVTSALARALIPSATGRSAQ